MVAHRMRHGNFASYYRRFRPESGLHPRCRCGAESEPRHLTVCPVTWKVSRKVKDKYQTDTEERLYKFVVGKGAEEWFPRLLVS